MSLYRQIRPKSGATPEPEKTVRREPRKTADIGMPTTERPSRKGIGGRPTVDDPKTAFTLRLPRSTLEKWKRQPDWRARMAEVLSKHAPE